MFFAQLDIDPLAPGWLLVLFAIVSGLLISVHLFALLVAVCVLPNLEAYKCVRLQAVPHAVDPAGPEQCPNILLFIHRGAAR
jgi:hypothetical protein